ncbi:tetraacyldisaccharide 4'-kinase, partial [Candidatus Pelagibacter bacterium]|nr:tetraacyldisaccharide 4'-kinase [Candidatus Pelagibacter bacterium]
FWDLAKPNFLSYLLIPFSLPIILRNFFFQFLKKKKSSNIKTICVGNIYLGGTGKTPLTIKISQILKQEGIKVATIKKNYSNQKDEQLLLKQKTSLIITESRKDAINQAIKEKYDVLVFDDGLQETKIDFDIKLVCFKSKIWIGNGQLIPAGPMREKISSLKRFDAVFLNGNSSNFEKIEKQIKNINLDIKIFKTFYRILDIQKYNLDSKYLIFSGIGDPFSFKDILVENKFNVVREMIFPDHHDYSLDDLEKILNIAKNKNLKIITTEKDFMKIPEEFKKEINFLTIDLVIQDEKKLIKLITK